MNGQAVDNHGIWFPIEPISQERYIHLGNVSHGFVTVVDYDKYPQIHDYLIQHRAVEANGKDIVGYMEVS